MAKKNSKGAASKLSKSDAIRTYKSDNPEVGPKAIAEHLNDEGYNVSAQFVSTVLSNDKRKSGLPMGARGRRPAGGGFSMDDLLIAKDLVRRLGSVEAAKAAVETYAKIIN